MLGRLCPHLLYEFAISCLISSIQNINIELSENKLRRATSNQVPCLSFIMLLDSAKALFWKGSSALLSHMPCYILKSCVTCPLHVNVYVLFVNFCLAGKIC